VTVPVPSTFKHYQLQWMTIAAFPARAERYIDHGSLVTQLQVLRRWRKTPNSSGECGLSTPITKWQLVFSLVFLHGCGGAHLEHAHRRATGVALKPLLDWSDVPKHGYVLQVWKAGPTRSGQDRDSGANVSQYSSSQTCCQHRLLLEVQTRTHRPGVVFAVRFHDWTMTNR